MISSIGFGPRLAWREQARTDLPFFRLAPAWMIDRGIHVGVEAVFVGRRDVPGRRRLLLGKADLDDRLDALEAVFPRHHQPQWSTVLVGQRLAIESDGKDRQRMHGFVDPQALDVGPVEDGEALSRHLVRTVTGLERSCHLGLTGNRDAPGLCPELRRAPGRLVLTCAKFVEVVVSLYIFK